MRGVLDDRDVVLCGPSKQRFKRDGHPAVVHHDDGPRSGRNGSDCLSHIDVAGERFAVNKDTHRSAQGNRISRRGEGIARHDHFVAGANVEQLHCHIECV